MKKTKQKKSLPSSLRKFVRRQKALWRKEALPVEEYKRRVRELYHRLSK